MEIRIEQLKERPRKLAFAEPIETFPVLCGAAESESVVFSGEIEVELVATLVDNLVEVEGTLNCTVELSCSRCLQPVVQRLELPLVLVFCRHQPAVIPQEEERELSEEEVGLIPFQGDSIDLCSPIADEVLMALPQHPLCRNECAGLCPTCGADLNRQGCGCTPPQFHGALAALKNFKVSKD